MTDQLAMARLGRATYSLIVSLLPAAATVVGAVVLAQAPSCSTQLALRASLLAWRCTASPIDGQLRRKS